MKRQQHNHNEEDEVGFRKDVAEAADKYPFFRVHLSASNRELMVMPIELLVEKIIGGNIFVFAALVRSNKALSELLENIPGIYRYLFYNVFVNERVVMSDMVLPHRLIQLNHIHELFSTLADQNETGSPEKLAIFSFDFRYNEEDALEIKSYAHLQQHLHPIGGPSGAKSDPFLSDSGTINQCRTDIVFAKKVAKYYNIVMGAGFAHASFLSPEQYNLRCHTLDAFYALACCHFTFTDDARTQTPAPRRNRYLEDVDSDSDSEVNHGLVFWNLRQPPGKEEVAVHVVFLNMIHKRIHANRTIFESYIRNATGNDPASSKMSRTLKVRRLVESNTLEKEDTGFLPMDIRFLYDVLVNTIMPYLLPREKFQHASIERVKLLIAKIKLDIDKIDPDTPWTYYHESMKMDHFNHTVAAYVMKREDVMNPLESRLETVNDPVKDLRDVIRELADDNPSLISLERQLDEIREKLTTVMKETHQDRAPRLTDITKNNAFFRKLFYETIKVNNNIKGGIKNNDYFYLRGGCASCMTNMAVMQEPGLMGRLFCSPECQSSYYPQKSAF